jgi:hypothetical protein
VEDDPNPRWQAMRTSEKLLLEWNDASRCHGRTGLSVKIPGLLRAFFIALGLTAIPRFAAVSQRLSLESRPSLDIGNVDGSAQYQLFRVSSVLRLDDGRIVVANNGTNELRIYSPRGSFIAAIGRAGAGPGEFRSINGVHVVGRDSLFVFDAVLQRVSILSGDGRFHTSLNVEPTGDALRPLRLYRLGGVLRNRNMVFVAAAFPADMRPRPITHFDSVPTLLYSREGKRLGRVAEPLGMDIYATPSQAGDISFGRASSAYIHGERVYVTDGGKLEVRAYEPGRGLVRTVRDDRPNRRVVAEDIDQLIKYRVDRVPDARKAEIRRYFEEWPKAPYKPWISAIMVDSEGLLWAEEYEPFWTNTSRTWTVFDQTGGRIARLNLPQSFRVCEIGKDFIIGVAKDEFDVEHVRVYTLIRSNPT